MSLRIRLNLLITFLFVLALLGGSSYIISGTKQTVENEMRSTAQLTSRLVELLWESLQFTQDPALQQRFIEGLERLNVSRHLQIIVARQGEIDAQERVKTTPAVPEAPAWFVSLVTPPSMEYRHVFSGENTVTMEVVIVADPSDELTEAWSEAKNAMLLLFLFVMTANIFIYFVLGKDLAPIETILAGLNRIEKGDYYLRLPKFALPELDRISEKFNHMAAVLQRSKEENRYLTQQSLAIQEQARRHLAQELHDELGQSLSAVKAVAVSIQQGSESGPRETKDNAGMIISFVDRMYDVAHSMMQRLRPSVLDELGLIMALQELVDGWNSRHGESFCRLSVSEAVSNINDNLSINVYRIVQESLTNISKYAQADEVLINISRELSESGDYLSLIIKDDGIGIDFQKSSEGLGILGIRERVEALAGEFDIQTRQGQGVQLKIVLPVSGGQKD